MTLLNAAQRSAMVRQAWADPVRRAARMEKFQAAMKKRYAGARRNPPQAPSSLEPGDRGVHYPDEIEVAALYRGRRYDDPYPKRA